MLEASWQDRLDSSEGRKIYHTIPRIKRVQNFQQNTPINDDRSSILYDEYPVRDSFNTLFTKTHCYFSNLAKSDVVK